MKDLIWYYRYKKPSLRYSQFLKLPTEARNAYQNNLEKQSEFEVTVYAFAIMPNHFHFLVRQEAAKGIQTYVSNISNGYAKYFNTKHKRTGSVWQRPFKAVRVETDEQFIHVSRYIHLNPVTSYIINENMLDNYQWTSLPEYFQNNTSRPICDTSMILSQLKNPKSYQTFIHDQVSYARELERIKHLSIDGDIE